MILKKLSVIFFLFTMLFCSLSIFAEDSSEIKNEYKWHKINGYWKTQSSSMISIRKRAIQWKYHELMNFNSLISTDDFKEFSKIETQIKAFSPLKKGSPEMMLFFSAQSPYKFYFYHFYAFKFSGDKDSINRVSFIKSDRIDPEKPYRTKNNYKVDELAKADCSLNFDKKYNFVIKFKDSHAILFIDGKEVLKGKLPADGYGGRVGFSNRNCRMSIDDFKIIKEGILSDDVIFHDDFSKDLIKRRTVKVRRVKNKK